MSPRDGLERQFPHLHEEAAKPASWRSPALAVAATALVVGLGAALAPVAQDTRDFRQEAAAGGAAADGYADVGWAALVPRHWDVATQVRELQAGQAGVTDDDPRARASLAHLRELLDRAPAEPSLDGRQVRLPGYVVPLDGSGGRGREFLLVPYFGACIHTPRPPANQVVHVVTEGPAPVWKAMDAVWVRGTLHVTTHTSAAAVSGYRLTAVSVDAHDSAVQP